MVGLDAPKSRGKKGEAKLPLYWQWQGANLLGLAPLKSAKKKEGSKAPASVPMLLAMAGNKASSPNCPQK
jgi:hypothetical protein